MRNDDPVFKQFGEIYFSCTNPNAIKAWHLHKKMTLNYAVISGSIKCVLYDDRKQSSTYGQLNEFFMSPENYFLLTVPPMIWNGWKGIGTIPSMVANCSSIPHDSKEIVRKEFNDSSIPYEWRIVNR